MSSGGGSGGGTNTVTSSQTVPLFEQQSSQNNQQLAESIGSQPYPTYNAPLVQGMDPSQTAGQTQALTAANAYQPGLTAATGGVESAMGQGGAIDSLTSPNAVSAYMNPYVNAAVQPQISDIENQIASQNNQINSTAAQGNAFGDARQGAASALNNYYGDQAINQVYGTGYSNAYTQALSALNNAATTQIGEQGAQYTGANDLANYAAAQQNLGLQGANATYNVGAQNQALGQQELNTAYQTYLNQVNWPVQMLNVQESALSNSPYNLTNQVTLPQSNTLASGLGSGLSLSSLISSLGSGGSTNSAPFSGQSMTTQPT
jgi:hypothetical protein